ncbi:MAG: trigger factor [Lachnospiraceae bacterium]|nr:trigger factor [Lachnospiraceae bacterium]
MSLQVEKLENSMAKLTIEVPAEEVEKAIEKAYQKNKSKISVPGFRKGKVPRKMIEKMYGTGVFYEDAANELIEESYGKELEACEEEIVSNPQIEITQIEEGKPFIYTAEVALKPEIKLGKYKGVKVEKIDTEVTEEEITAAIDQEREHNAREINVTDRAVKSGDQIILDFDGSVDGVPFDGGKGENYPLTIGSNSFIPGFEDQLIGAEIGKELDVNVTFPEDYHAEELKGKASVFKCTVKEIKEKQLPELDDEFAGEVSEFETVADYKADVKKKLEAKKEDEAKAKKEDEVLKAIITDSEIEIPAPMLETQQRQQVNDFAQRLQMQGLSIEQYFQFSGLTPEKMMEQMKPQAEQRIQARLVLEAIVKAENIEVTDADYDAEVAKMAEQYKMEADKVKELLGEKGKKDIMKDLAVSKAADFVVENAKEGKAAAKTKKAAKKTEEAAE